MLEGRYDAWEREVAQKAAQEAARDAMHENSCELLETQLNEKFGEQPDDLLTAMRALELDALKLAARRIIHATSVEAVFEGLL